MSLISLTQAMKQLPLVAILRGITPNEVLDYAKVLIDIGYRVIEVPLNSPDAFKSIELLSKKYADIAIIGAGTVVTKNEVEKVIEAGGRIIISPHSDVELIRFRKSKGLYCVPGFYTPTEGFAALHAGADALKFFPADTAGPKGLKAITAVLSGINIYPVGGVSPKNQDEFVNAGASGFGLGSGLYKAGMGLEEFTANAKKYAAYYL
jgi:2-dehydro-3-deoxyphosphogalactonate aldolase